MALVGQQHELHVDPADDVLDLDDPATTDAARAGAKAAALARARAAGLPALPGVVVSVAAVDRNGADPPAAMRVRWNELSDGGARSVVVRSSSTAEDLASGSMAGLFESVVDVRGWDGFVDAYRTVVGSAGSHPMAVLVQPHLDPDIGGVAFGIDPVTGRTDHRSIVAVIGGPHDLVSGRVEGRQTVVNRAGRIVEVRGDREPRLGRRMRRRLLAMEEAAAELFGGPQDVEWAVCDGTLRLLQSRPVTTTAHTGQGPVLGPGPVAETFPDPLAPLEVDLWIPPLRAAMISTLALSGSASNAQLRRSPVLQVVDAQVAVDLELIGADPAPEHRVRRVLDPRPSIRRLRAAWRTGRLRAALPSLASALLDDVDAELERLAHPRELCDEQLLRVLDNASAYLRSLHAFEMLSAGLPDDGGGTGAELALRAVVRGRRGGLTDDDIVARHPEVLALLPPAIGPRGDLPAVERLPSAPVRELSLRESLRLRIRWVHELTSQVAGELGRRLTARGRLPSPEDIRRVTLESLRAAVTEVRPVVLVAVEPAASVPLPARFQLDDDGHPVAIRTRRRLRSGAGDGVAAGGGRGRGAVALADPRDGDVLVTRTLDPSLAPLLPRLAGLVAETGSPLSHLAILAREHGVPTIVGVHDATTRWAPGTVLTVDGDVGRIDAEPEATP